MYILSFTPEKVGSKRDHTKLKKVNNGPIKFETKCRTVHKTYYSTLFFKYIGTLMGITSARTNQSIQEILPSIQNPTDDKIGN